MSYEKDLSAQADLRIVRRSTIERKQMSTKTTFKRVALVTVAALGLSFLAVAPSNALPQADTLSLSAATGSTTVGTATTVDATVAFLQETSSDSMTLTLSYDAAPAGITVGESAFSSITAVTTDLGTPTVDTFTVASRTAKVSAFTAASIKKTLTISLNPTKAGTYVIRVTPTITGNTTNAPVATYKTWTVTVAAKTIGKSSAFIGVAGNGTTDTATVDATAALLTFSASAAVASKARIDVASIYGTTGNETVTAADAPIVVVTTDKGLVSKTNDYSAAAKSVTTLAAVDGDPIYWVFSNGDIGAASITITVGGVLVATKTVTFAGVAASLAVADLTTGQDSWVKVAGSSTRTIVAKDSALSTLTTVPTGLTVKSSDTSVATVAIHATNGTVTITGVKAGTATITVTDPATTSAAAPVSFTATVAPVRPTAAPTVTFDAASYEAGSLVTMTVSANMGDSASAELFTSDSLKLSAVVVASGTAVPTTGLFAIVGGKATYKFYAPSVSGKLSAVGTTGGAVDITTAVVINQSVAITNASSDAAQAAAEEATAAANDATDAALSAAEAADAATAMAQEAVDAVAELSAQVTKLISDLKAQITALTTLVAKISKKVKA
jgi:trimeric autotransporter adhesin